MRTGRIRRSSAATSGAVKAAVIGAIATLLAAGIGAAVVLSQQGGPSSTFASALQVVDMQVIDKQPPLTKTGTYEAAKSAGLVITLRNPGNGVSVITRARFVVERFVALSTIDCGVQSGNFIPISAHYQVDLPPVAHPGQVIDAPLSQEVPANSADKIRLGLALSTTPPYPYINAVGTGASRIYQLRVEFIHDNARTPTRGGLILMTLPFPSNELFRAAGHYASRNSSLLNRMLSAQGDRSADLVRFAKNPIH